MNYYFRNTGNSWADPNNWSDTDGGAAHPSGVIPTTTDDVFFTANSGDVIQDTGVNTIIGNLDCTGYTGTMSLTAAEGIPCSLTMGGNITFSSTMSLVFGSSTLGIINATASTITTSGHIIRSFVINGTTAPVITLMDTLNADQITFNTATTAVTWTGSFGFITNNLVSSDNIGKTITFEAGNEYKTSSFTAIANDGALHGKIVSSVPGTRARFTVTGEEQVAFMDFTDIDASGGRTIYTFNGVVTNCINVYSFVEPIAIPDSTVASSFAI
jgi:hypothetical protein